MKRAHRSATNELLGYPDDARLLLVNADDFGMYPDVNEAVVRSFREGVVRSTTLMVPCPGAPQAIRLLKENPGIRFGVHLSVIRDIEPYRWGPVAPAGSVPSLVDADGHFLTTDRMDEFLDRARLDELEVEFRAQIEVLLAAGLRPTHLDWHCLHSGGRADVFGMTVGLANEYGLALRVASQPFMDQIHARGLPATDHEMLDSFRIDVADKPARYADMLRNLPVGLTEWAVHPSLGGAESRAIDPDGWRVRRSDFDVLVSPDVREIITREGITLIGYEPLQKVWQDRAS